MYCGQPRNLQEQTAAIAGLEAALKRSDAAASAHAAEMVQASGDAAKTRDHAACVLATAMSYLQNAGPRRARVRHSNVLSPRLFSREQGINKLQQCFCVIQRVRAEQAGMTR